MALCRVIYFVLAVCFSECVDAMLKIREEEIVSTILLNVAATSIYIMIPLLDALSPAVDRPGLHLSKSLLRSLATVSVLFKLYILGRCKIWDTVACHKFYKSYTWSVSATSASANATTQNSTLITEQHTHIILSALDLRLSCDSLVCLSSPE